MTSATSTLTSELLNYSDSQLSALLLNLSHKERAEVCRLLEVKVNRDLWEAIKIRKAAWDCGPLLWLTQHTKTEDTHWLPKGTEFTAPFPKREYLRIVMEYLLWEQCELPGATPVLFLPKSREMLMSWLVCGFITWMCQWYPVFWVAQTGKEDKVAELIEYARTLYRNQPEWMKNKNPLVVDNDVELVWAQGGRFLGVPKGADQSRIHHPYGYFQDESGFLPEAQQAFDAVRPVCRQAICVSTDEIGWFHNECKLEA